MALDDKQTYVLIFNLAILVILPILFIIIKSVSLRNYPKLDLFLLYNSIVFFAQIIFYACAIHSWGTTFLYRSYPSYDSDPWVLVVMIVIFVLNFIIGLFGFIVTNVSLMKNCGGETQHHYPIPREETSEAIRKYIQVIAETGPTLVKGKMVKTGQDGNFFFWGCKWWSQFEYKSWRNVSVTGVEEIERWMQDGKCFMIRTHVVIEPDDLETKKQYEEWCPRIGQWKKTNGFVLKHKSTRAQELCLFWKRL